MPTLRRALERRQVENPRLPLSSKTLLAWLAGDATNAGVDVTPEKAMRVSAVYRSVALIAGAVAGLPLLVYKANTRDRQDVPVLRYPNPDQTAFEFWEYALTSMLLFGNSYSWRARTQGNSEQLWPIHPGRVTPRWEKSRGARREFESRKVFDITAGDTKRTYTSDQILHIPALSYDGLCGMSPIGAARQAVGLALAAEEYGGRFFSGGSLMSGILQTDQRLDEETATRLKQRWQEKLGGLSKAHEVAVIDAGAKFQPLSMPHDDAQFLETRRFQVSEVARLYGVPPHMLMDVEKSTSWGTGIEQQSIGFVQYTLDPWLKRIERRVTKELLNPETQYAEFLVEGLLRGDTKTRYEAYQIAITNRWMSPGEVRDRENLGPAPQDLAGGTDIDETP